MLCSYDARGSFFVEMENNFDRGSRTRDRCTSSQIADAQLLMEIPIHSQWPSTRETCIIPRSSVGFTLFLHVVEGQPPMVD